MITEDPLPFWTFFVPLNCVLLGTFALMSRSDRRWVHWAGFTVVYGAVYVGFIDWNISGAPALDPAAS